MNNGYTHEELKEFVESFYGQYQFNINVKSLRLKNGKTKIPNGSDRLYDNMNSFLQELDKRGYKIVKK